MATMTEAEARAAWLRLNTSNPFVFFGQAMGREPLDELPGVGELLFHVLGLTKKNPSEVLAYERDV